MNDIARHDLAQEGELHNAAVLDLHILKAIGALLVIIRNHAQRIK